MNTEAKNILISVCKTLDVPVTMVLSSSRIRGVVDARYLAIYFVKKKYETITFNELGHFFYPLNYASPHSMILYALEKVKGLLETDKMFKLKFQQCENELNGDMSFENMVQL